MKNLIRQVRQGNAVSYGRRINTQAEAVLMMLFLVVLMFTVLLLFCIGFPRPDLVNYIGTIGIGLAIACVLAALAIYALRSLIEKFHK